MPTTRQIELIRKKEFATAVFDPEDEAFVVHITAIGPDSNIYSSHKAQIAFLKVTQALTSILSKYTDFANVFSENLAVKFLKHIKINDHAIDLVESQ